MGLTRFRGLEAGTRGGGCEFRWPSWAGPAEAVVKWKLELTGFKEIPQDGQNLQEEGPSTLHLEVDEEVTG